MAVLIRWVLDALFVAKELDAVLSNQLPMAHQLAVGSIFLRAPRLFLACNAQVAAQRVESASFATGLAIESSTRHTAVLPIVECNQAPIAKFLPYWQCQGCCLRHHSKTYTR